MEFICLAGQQLAQNRSGGNRSQEIASLSRAFLVSGVETVLRVVKGFLHKRGEGDGAELSDLGGKLFSQRRVQCIGRLFRFRRGGEIDGVP